MKIWTKEQRVALGVSDKEEALLEVLAREGAVNTSALAYSAKIPRVTTMRILKMLKERGFVTRTLKGREVLWSLVRPALLEKRLTHLFADGDAGAYGAGKKNIALSEVGSLAIYHGEKEILASNQKMLVAHPGERVLAIEPNGVWKHVAESSAEDWVHLNALFTQKNILIEVVLEEGFEKVMADGVHPDVSKGFFDLAKEVRVVPAGFLDSATEILIFRDQILFTDWAHMVAVEIKNPSTVRVMRAMYRLLQESGRRTKGR